MDACVSTSLGFDKVREGASKGSRLEAPSRKRESDAVRAKKPLPSAMLPLPRRCCLVPFIVTRVPTGRVGSPRQNSENATTADDASFRRERVHMRQQLFKGVSASKHVSHDNSKTNQNRHLTAMLQNSTGSSRFSRVASLVLILVRRAGGSTAGERGLRSSTVRPRTERSASATRYLRCDIDGCTRKFSKRQALSGIRRAHGRVLAIPSFCPLASRTLPPCPALERRGAVEAFLWVERSWTCPGMALLSFRDESPGSAARAASAARLQLLSIRWAMWHRWLHTQCSHDQHSSHCASGGPFPPRHPVLLPPHRRALPPCPLP